MLLTDEATSTIRFIFSKVQTKEELLQLINAVKSLVNKSKEGQKPNLVRIKTLTFFADHRLSGRVRYHQFSIRKKSGGVRNLSAPNASLKEIQRYLAIILSTVYEPKSCVTGFTAQRSIVDNATPHVGKQFVFNVDLKDFFPSIQLHRVKAVLKLPPFSLIGERENLAFLIARLCCITTAENIGVLPQGAPTSPILSNIVCQKLDHRLSGLAKRYGVSYTRYADDITFSSDKSIFHKGFRRELRRIIEDQHFTINQAKVRLQGIGYRQEVTGLTVNEKVNVSKRYIREVRAMLHNWQKKGHEQAEQIFRQHYQADKGHIKQDKSILKNVLHGKLNYLKMVRGETDSTYLFYRNQFEVLEGRPPIELRTDVRSPDSQVPEEQSIEQLLAKLEKQLSLWENGGLNSAYNNGDT